MKTFYLHSALNLDKDSCEKIDMQTNKILKKVFREIEIDKKMKSYCAANSIINDFKSINIERFIENFIQTYPYYLSNDGNKKEIAEALNLNKNRPIRKRQSSGVFDAPMPNEDENKADEFMVVKPPNASDELNNYIKYSF